VPKIYPLNGKQLASHKEEKNNRHIMRKILVMMHNRCLVMSVLNLIPKPYA